MARSYDLVVLGAGPGGYAAAFMAADLGMKVALVDQDPTLGGVCLNRGCIPSKALLHAARVITEAQEATEWGLEFGAPKIDLVALRKKKEAVVGKLAGGVSTLAKSRKVEWLKGRGAFANATTLNVTLDGQTEQVTFGHAIIATGSRPAIPKSLQLDDPRVMDSTFALNLPDIPRRLLVVGGGYIGMELGTVYAALGSAVTVVEGTNRLLGGADPDLVRPVQARAKKVMKAILFETNVESLAPHNDGIAATFSNAQGKTTEIFDRVLVSVGRRPNHENLGLENTKVRVTDRGFIEVNKKLATAEPRIFAIGDVIGDPMLAHKATHEGRAAAEIIHGRDIEFDPRAIPAVVFTDPEIAWCGLTEEAAKAAGREVAVAKFPWGASGRATTLARNDGLTKLILEPESGRVLGMGICGVGAGDLISEGVLAMEMGAVAEDIGRTIHPHPTLSETLMEAADVFFGQSTHVFTKKP